MAPDAATRRQPRLVGRVLRGLRVLQVALRPHLRAL